MYPISFEHPRRKSITSTYTIFDWEHAGVIPFCMDEFRRNRRILTEVIVRTDGQTDKQADVIYKHFLIFTGKVLKRS